MPKNNTTQTIDIFDELGLHSRKRISEDLFIKLRDAILSGKLPGGYTFPNETELCKKLDIGRSTLREAYAPLETMNLITRTKTGTFVNEEAATRNSMNFDKIAQYTDPQNIIEYRFILEVGIAKSAARLATRQDIQELSEIVDKMEQNELSVETLTFLDFAFHQKLARITGNELLIISLDSIRTSYEHFVNKVFATRSMYQQSIVDHRSIIQALVEQDPEKAEVLMSSHLQHIKVVALGERD